MDYFNTIGKTLIYLGLILCGLGILFLIIKRIPFLQHLGHLPGDIHLQKENFQFYFPITTCILISGLGSLLLYLWHKPGR